MPNLVGTGLNQIPINGMLGGLAYQDPEHASIKDLDLKNISQINAEIADTAVDIFVYDTSKDSDGGAWRKRTQHTSWYNETLGTTTRGTRREFPAVAVIVTESNKVKIYDGDDPDLPMWMVFDGGSLTDMIYGLSQGQQTSTKMLNGLLVSCGNDPAGQGGVFPINFLNDTAFMINDATVGPYKYNGFIAQRNDTLNIGIDQSFYGSIVDRHVNDVVMTVLPNAPIDDTTGLPIPTIAVATNGGVSVIKDDGNVINATGSGIYAFSKAITITEENYLWWLGDNYLTNDVLRDSWAVSLDNLPSSDFTWNSSTDNMSGGSYYAVTTNGEQGEIRIGPGNTWAWNKQERNALGGPSGLAIHKPNIGLENNSLIVAITSDYNTGWMHGAIKGAFLSDTDTTNVEELITNGTFDSDTTGWTSHNGATITHTTPSAAGIDTPATDGRPAPSSAGIIKIVSNGGASGAYQAFTTIVGKTYTASFLAYQVSYSSNYVYIGTTINGNQNFDFYDEWDQSVNNNWASGSATFTATATTTYITLVPSQVSGRVLYMDEIKVHLEEEDRSVKNKGLAVYGTITKSAVATGAELVAYSGFSASNYLQQPYNSGIMPGTGSFCVIGWYNQNSVTATTEPVLLSIGSLSDTNKRLQCAVTNDNRLVLWTHEGSGFTYATTPDLGSEDSNWYQVIFLRDTSGYMRIYRNGIEQPYQTNQSPGTIRDISWTDAVLQIGTPNYDTSRYFEGNMSLWRFSSSIPSVEQIKKIYEDERWLFQENAKATLYGSSDAVTALAYDDTTELLHVGTSAGRSDFQGLRRINNTTDPVTTAISAHDSLIIEQ